MRTEKDLKQLKGKGISLKTIEQQILFFKNGIDFVNIIGACIPGNGILVPENNEIDFYNRLFEKSINNYSFTRFIPASGAASRMFKALYEAEDNISHSDNAKDFIEKNPALVSFFSNIEDYPFSNDLKEYLSEKQFKRPSDYSDSLEILQALLFEKGLNYGKLPKGLLKFHSYTEGQRTAFEEHLHEALLYLADNDNNIHLHFTVSPEHRDLFVKLADDLCQKLLLENYHFKISFSEQKSATDTIAVDLNNNVFRNQDRSMLFRPGGHGALLDNLNDLKEQIVFMGNIDNIAPERSMEMRARYKKLLGGLLIEKQNIVHALLRKIEKRKLTENIRKEVEALVEDISPVEAEKFQNLTDEKYLERAFYIFNRPIRIAGMVKNVGEPGGGPFWVKNKDGETGRQIIESSQIDMNNAGQKNYFESATHFNPVDLACFVYDYKGRKFNLNEFRDPEMGFISRKSQGGKDLKALELPGLWNGSMAGWLSWFVDVPIETFTPVKTVFDLVREAHRS